MLHQEMQNLIWAYLSSYITWSHYLPLYPGKALVSSSSSRASTPSPPVSFARCPGNVPSLLFGYIAVTFTFTDSNSNDSPQV